MLATLRTLISGYNDRAVLVLSLTQTIGYGSLYYAYGVLAAPIAREFDVGLDTFFAVFAVGLLLGGLVAPFTGRLIDRHGARPIMAVGSVLAALSLGASALALDFYSFVAATVILEAATCLVTYEAAFAGLTQIFRHEARARITAITLVAGFASTIFWPLTQALYGWLGWRGTFLVFAAINLLICAPLHWTMLKKALPVDEKPAQPGTMAAGSGVLEGAARQRALILYATAICVSGIVYSAFPIHMLRIIESEGFSAEAAALIAMVMGPAQVCARIVEITFGQRFDALTTGRVALIGLLVAIGALLVSSGTALAAIVFAALYGASQGLITIARGTVPLQLFGIHGYATLVGRITGLRFLFNAASPFLFAFIATRFSMSAALAASGIAAALGLAAYMALPRPRPDENGGALT